VLAVVRTGLITLCALLNGAAIASDAPSSAFTEKRDRPLLAAHRGFAQTYSKEGVGNDTCTASRIQPPTHAYLENTIPSMQAAIRAGADVIELDVHPTTDGQFAVFHDWALECRTEGKGRTRDHSMAGLKRLDVGYGYTADNGKTFPFRGKGVGLMPALSEVLQTFPSQRLVINVKSDDPAEGVALAQFLNGLPAAQRRNLAVYGGDQPIAQVRERVPEVLTMSRASLKTCYLRYFVVGWTGYTPSACSRMLVLTPLNIGPWLWGWPNGFVQRMRQVGSAVFVQGDYGGGWSVGIDTVEDLQRLPPGFTGGIWTDEIERIAKHLGR
jgi:glycerophosphoryl diester phosphodiesterase